MTQYQIKSLKTFEMRNGVALTANLYRNNKLIAYLEDEGNGGGLSVRWAQGHVWNNPEERNDYGFLQYSCTKRSLDTRVHKS